MIQVELRCHYPYHSRDSFQQTMRIIVASYTHMD